MKIPPMGVELLHAYRQTNGKTDITKLVVDFRSRANAPENSNTKEYLHRICLELMIIKSHTVNFIISGNGEVRIKTLSEVTIFIKI
jgi:hypothetical protein